MSNGFVIANRRNYQKRLVMRGFWDNEERKLIRSDDDRTATNFRKIRQTIGHCPYTQRMMEKKGWKLWDKDNIGFIETPYREARNAERGQK